MTGSSIDAERKLPAPLVTAVLVCWNHERFARAAVLSALQQDYRNIQLIVFDNGSTDGSRKILTDLQQEYQFTLIFQENIGLVRTLNRALEMAKGEYFALLSTDDIWLPEKTKIQVEFFEAHKDVHHLSGQIEGIDSAGKFTSPPIAKRWGETSFKELMSEGNRIHGPTVMCRTATLKDLGGYDESVRIEDFTLALKLTYLGYRVVVLPETLTLYRFHGLNWTAKSIDPEFYEVGSTYRHTPEYAAFYRHHFPLTFWRLVKDGYKLRAMRLLLSEPVPWTWMNVGRGMVRMFIPYSLIRAYRVVKGKRPEGEPIDWPRPAPQQMEP